MLVCTQVRGSSDVELGIRLTLLAKHRRSDACSSSVVEAWDDSVQSAAIVPHRHATDFPLPTDGVVVCGVHVVLKKLHQEVYTTSAHFHQR